MVEKSKKSIAVQQFLEFSQFPYAKVDHNVVKWFDLRLTNDGKAGFLAKVEFDENSSIVSEEITIF